MLEANNVLAKEILTESLAAIIYEVEHHIFTECHDDIEFGVREIRDRLDEIESNFTEGPWSGGKRVKIFPENYLSVSKKIIDIIEDETNGIRFNNDHDEISEHGDEIIKQVKELAKLFGITEDELAAVKFM